MTAQARDALTHHPLPAPGPGLTVRQAEELHALITDAQLDGNLHGQAPEQRDRLRRAKALAREVRIAAHRDQAHRITVADRHHDALTHHPLPGRASDHIAAIAEDLTGLAAVLPPGMPQHTRVTAALAALQGTGPAEPIRERDVQPATWPPL